MDRLEKALQKAREMRQRMGGNEPTLGSPGGAPGVPPRAVPVQPARQSGASPTPPVVANVAGAQSVGVVVPDDVLEHNRIVSRLTRNANADIFRILRTKVTQAMARDNMRTIAVTSANYGEGKTTVATNLALSIALDVKQTVLLVDLDLRSPSVHKYLGLQTDIGLSDFFVDDKPVYQCLVKPAFDRLVVLPITKPIENSSELLGTPKMAQLAHELKTRYADRLVIYDMPPLLSQDDTLAFLPHVDGVILVIRDGVTTAEDVEHCMHNLEGAKLIGTVLNNCDETSINKT